MPTGGRKSEFILCPGILWGGTFNNQEINEQMALLKPLMRMSNEFPEALDKPQDYKDFQY